MQEFTEEALPGAWTDGETNGAAIERALCHQRGERKPWGFVRESISEAANSRRLDVASGGSGRRLRDRRLLAFEAAESPARIGRNRGTGAPGGGDQPSAGHGLDFRSR